VRAGGKHNDLDNVGYTARHHTFFEMLGNFQLRRLFQGTGDRARLDPADEGAGACRQGPLLVTVYHTDDEAFDLWKKIAGLPEDRIIRIATKDNFWAMGDDGPCGPCSEIFFDHGDHIPGGPPGIAGRGRRPLRRDLEPGVHAVRAGRRRDPATCRAPASTPAWGWSASPPCCRACTTISRPTPSGADRRQRGPDRRARGGRARRPATG
jgi:hypothetical protein